MIASVQAIEKFIETYKAYTKAREYLLYGYDGSEREVYTFLNPEQFDKISRTLGKRPVHAEKNGVDSWFIEHNGCVFCVTRAGDVA